jgi:hypothetical protein
MEDHGDERSFLLMLFESRQQIEVGKDITVIKDEKIIMDKKPLQSSNRTSGTKYLWFMGTDNVGTGLRLVSQIGPDLCGEMVDIDSYFLNPKIFQLRDNYFK